ncbi:MAG: hypothetical protein M1828_000422 [Chrysothrix sp. TS-e1954]|nr:MAG: hypothetical protein M1828_000422 [Chrysothrix sp. TS-e1954]
MADDLEKSPGHDLPSRSSSGDLKDARIEYRYLTHSTVTPAIGPLSGATSKLPRPPNLKKYDDPMEWSSTHKRLLIAISCIGTMFTAYSAGTYAPAVQQMTQEFNVSRVASLVGVTVFTIGFGVAPMVLAPFSEINGRRPVFVTTGIIYVGCTVAQAGTRTYVGMLISRFLAGCSSSTFSTMVGGVVADIYKTEERNTPMALFTGFVLLGTGLGPIIGGVIAQHTTWRWVFGVHSIAVGLVMVAVVFFFDETRGSVLLSKKAKVLNEWYSACEEAGCVGVEVDGAETEKPTSIRRIRWKVQADEERSTLVQMIKISLLRPMHLLFTEPVVFFFSLWISFAWGILYLMFSAIPYVFQTVYGFSLQQSNAVFASVCVTSILATLLSIYQEKVVFRMGKLSSAPEGRLFFSCVESSFLPIGMFWFGWSASSSTPWIVPTLGVASATLGIFSVYLATFNYLADTYHRYASSAIAAQSFSRNLMGGAFPLFTEQMYRRLGIGGASSLLGGVAVLLTLVPWVLALKGPRIRARSNFASELMK